MQGELSYNDHIGPKGISPGHMSEPELYALKNETREDVKKIFIDICSAGPQMRHLRLARVIDNAMKRADRYNHMLLIGEVVKKFRLGPELVQANRILRNEVAYRRMLGRT